MVQLYHADPAKICVIPCGFDPQEFWPVGKTLARLALGYSATEKIVLQLGRMVPRKGIDTVIRGIACLVQQYGIQARLVVVGGDSDHPDPAITPEIGRLRAIAEAAGILDSVQ